MKPSHLVEGAGVFKSGGEDVQREGGQCRGKGILLPSLRATLGPLDRSSVGRCKFLIRKLATPGSKMGCLEGR